MFKRANMVTIDDVVALVTPSDAEGLGRGGGRGMKSGGGRNLPMAPRQQAQPPRLNRAPQALPQQPLPPQRLPHIPPNAPPHLQKAPRPQAQPDRRPRGPMDPRRPRHHHGHGHHGHGGYWGGGYPYYYPMLSEVYVVEQQCVFEARVGNILSGTYPLTQEGYEAALMRARTIAGEVLLRCGNEYFDPAIVLKTWGAT